VSIWFASGFGELAEAEIVTLSSVDEDVRLTVGALLGVEVGLAVGDVVGVGEVAVGCGVAVGVEVGSVVAVDDGEGEDDGLGEGVGFGWLLVTVTWVTPLPPDPTISNPSGPTATSPGAGCSEGDRSVPFTAYAKIMYIRWVWFWAAPVLLYVLYAWLMSSPFWTML
jgi:hypothetical protein